MRVFDIHLHVQPWSMVRADALAMIDDASHRDARAVISNADSVLRFLDENGVERACCINYVAPEVMGFTPEVNDWIANFTRDHRDRLLPVGSVHPRHARDPRAMDLADPARLARDVERGEDPAAVLVDGGRLVAAAAAHVQGREGAFADAARARRHRGADVVRRRPVGPQEFNQVDSEST